MKDLYDPNNRQGNNIYYALAYGNKSESYEHPSWSTFVQSNLHNTLTSRFVRTLTVLSANISDVATRYHCNDHSAVKTLANALTSGFDADRKNKTISCGGSSWIVGDCGLGYPSLCVNCRNLCSQYICSSPSSGDVVFPYSNHSCKTGSIEGYHILVLQSDPNTLTEPQGAVNALYGLLWGFILLVIKSKKYF